MRRLGLGRAFAARRAFAAIVLWGACAPAAHGDCIVVQERSPQYAAHVAIHFGSADGVPSVLKCSSPLDKTQPAFAIPIYAYNLRVGADAFELALRLPRAPIGFDPGPGIALAAFGAAADEGAFVAGLRLESIGPVCGPALLGSLKLSTADLPDAFAVTIEPLLETGRCSVRIGGIWQPLVSDAGGAQVGLGATCSLAPCVPDRPISDLAASPGDQPGVFDLLWTPGTGNETLICFRTDGRYPADPWDGQLMAVVPSSAPAQYTHRFERSGTVHIAAWSVTRVASGALDAASNLDCGALVTANVVIPVGVAPRSWGQVKTTYR